MLLLKVGPKNGALQNVEKWTREIWILNVKIVNCRGLRDQEVHLFCKFSELVPQGVELVGEEAKDSFDSDSRDKISLFALFLFSS